MGAIIGYSALAVALCVLAGYWSQIWPRMMVRMDTAQIESKFRMRQIDGVWHGWVAEHGLTHLTAVHHTPSGVHAMLRRAVFDALNVEHEMAHPRAVPLLVPQAA